MQAEVQAVLRLNAVAHAQLTHVSLSPSLSLSLSVFPSLHQLMPTDAQKDRWAELFSVPRPTQADFLNVNSPYCSLMSGNHYARGGRVKLSDWIIHHTIPFAVYFPGMPKAGQDVTNDDMPRAGEENSHLKFNLLFYKPAHIPQQAYQYVQEQVSKVSRMQADSKHAAE